MDNMASWKNSWRIALQGIRKNFTSLRFYTVLFVVIIFSWTQIRDVKRYAVSQGLGVSCWYYPFLFSTFICTLFLYFGVVLLFCNAPFVDGHQLFVILRSGKKTWFRGQMLFIVLSSIGYFTYIWVISIVLFLPRLGITADWGSVLWEIVKNQRLVVTGGFLLSERTLMLFSPIKACLLVWLLNVLIGCFLGFLIFYCNLYKSKAYGSLAAMAVVFISNVIAAIGDYGNMLLYVSPVNWADLYNYSRVQRHPSIPYTISVLVILNIILVVLILRRSRKYSIEAAEDL